MIPKGINAVFKEVPDILEDGEDGLSGIMRQLVFRLTDNPKEMDRQVHELEKQIQLWHEDDEASRKLEGIPGIVPITASAIVATVGNAREFKDGRQLAAWMGLVPRQNSSGGKQTLLGISKRGDTYLRTLLIHGARSVSRFAENKAQPDSCLMGLIGKRNKNVAAVALPPGTQLRFFSHQQKLGMAGATDTQTYFCARSRKITPGPSLEIGRSSRSPLGAYFRKMWGLTDKPKAVTAAHKLSRLVYTMLTKGDEYSGQGQDYYEER